jgi:acyl-CoA synthetase (NDP forming)/GNAT superfamily N-acetyltransferase
VSAHAGDGAYALLADGTTIEIRPAGPDDVDAVRDMHGRMSPDNLYLRFFSMSSVAAEQAVLRICREPGADHAALLAVRDGEVVGYGICEMFGDGLPSAEVAFAVADDMHSRGVGTLLLEHLISLAQGRRVRTLVAETLSENAVMLRVFADAGLRAERALADGVYQLTFPLPGDEADAALGAYRDAVADRERYADVASLRHVLAPASVAVIGPSRRPGSVGRAIVRNIVTGGFSGPVYVVNPGGGELEGVPCVPSVAALPEQIDLAVIAVPAAAVPGIAEECGRRGVRAIVVIASGFGVADRTALLGICRRYSMRMVGPASFGVASPGIGLNASFAARHPGPGGAGLALQATGGIGFVLVEHLSRLGVGISSLVSLGDKDDVSGTDMLLWWASDKTTKLAVLYVESIRNPPKFARTARGVARTMPVLTVTAGRRLPAAHATAVGTPLLTRQALFQQAGVIATANLGELLDAAALLASQPVPTGGRVAVVSNTRGGGILAADVCGDIGLQVAALTTATQQALRRMLPPRATVAGPVDTTARVTPGTFRQCLELAGADPGVDAVLALTATTAAGDLVPQVSAARLQVPIAAAVMDQVEAVRLLPGPGTDCPAVPAYAYPESAARALGHAARYGTWRATPPGRVPGLDGIDPDRAKEMVAGLLADAAAGRWLPPGPTADLLGCYGIPLAGSIAVPTEDAAPAAQRPGGRLAGALAQPLTTDGIEVTISVLHEQVLGPLVLIGVTGAADELADRAARIAPLTDSDADELIRSVPAAPPPPGRRGAPATGLPALKDLLLRVSRLADDLPQVAELELSPVTVGPGGAQALDARIRIRAAESRDAYLRRLP